MDINVPGENLLIQIDNIFTKSECKKLIKHAEKTGWHQPGTGGSYLRSMLISTHFAKLLEKRIGKYIPKIYDAVYYSNGKPLKSYQWQYVGINDHFRFSKYSHNGKFPMHNDGQNFDKDDNQSYMTINIFLNDDFNGGETEFYHDPEYKPDGAFESRFVVDPKIGRGALFFHDQAHTGNKVKNGYKYLIRTDVMGRQIGEKYLK